MSLGIEASGFVSAKALRRRWWVVLLAPAVLPAGAVEIVGKVVDMADGDPLTTLVDRREVTIWLAVIDAPERGAVVGRRRTRRRSLSGKAVATDYLTIVAHLLPTHRVLVTRHRHPAILEAATTVSDACSG